MASLLQISEICGVSLGTASKALSGKPGVGKNTRQRILSVAQQHNYRPNRLVHAIQRGTSMVIGITCSQFDNEFAGKMLAGIFEVLYRADYQAMVIHWERSVQEGVRALSTLTEHRVDGILMFPPAIKPEGSYLDELHAFPNPIVVVDQSWPGCNYPLVGSQDMEGTFAATEHLIEQGHVRIAHIGYTQSSTGVDRLRGFQKAMVRHGVAIHEKWLCDLKEYPSEEAYTLSKKLLSAPERPTAIVAFNDEIALQALAAASDLGLSVPQELSLTGFGDLGVGRHIRPQVTTVAQQPDEIGRQAASILLKKIKDKDSATSPQHPPLQLRLPTELLVRQSTAKPIAP